MPSPLFEVTDNADRKATRILTRLEAIGQNLPADIVMLLYKERRPPMGKRSQIR